MSTVTAIYYYQCGKCDRWTESEVNAASMVCPCGGQAEWKKARYNTVREDRSKEVPFPQVSVFKPYTENNLGKRPVEIETRKQRDAILAEKGLTYDGQHYTKRAPYVPAADQVTLDEVMQHVHDPENQEPIRACPPASEGLVPLDGEPPVVRTGSGEIDP